MIIKQNSIVPFANVAQSVEQLIRNQQVMGSSPIISSKLRSSRSFFVLSVMDKIRTDQNPKLFGIAARRSVSTAKPRAIP